MPKIFINSLPRLFMTFLFFAMVTPSTFAGDGPSFDCSKAKTEVEKLVCGSPGLSKMDLELSEIYSKLASGLGEAEKASLKKEQVEWIKGRAKRIEEGILPAGKPEDVQKKKEANLKEEYEARIALIKAQLEKRPVKDLHADSGKADVKTEAVEEVASRDKSLGAAIAPATASKESATEIKTEKAQNKDVSSQSQPSESQGKDKALNQAKDGKAADSANQSSDFPPPVKTEAEKAQRVKALLEMYTLDFDGQLSKGTPEFCKGFYEAMRTADKSIEYIEPVLRTDDPDHPEFHKYKKCEEYIKSPESFVTDYDAVFTTMHDSVGDTAFRLYRFDPYGNPKKAPVEMIYGEKDQKSGFIAYNSLYLIIEYSKCSKVCEINVQNENWKNRKAGRKENYSALIRYKGEYFIFALFEIAPDESVHAYELDLFKYSKNRKKFDSKFEGLWYIK